jgi:hypothetical protein
MLSDVTKPHPVRRMGSEVAFHEVIMRGRKGFPAAAFALVTYPTNARMTHDPSDAFSSAGHSPFHREVGMNPGSTIGSAGAFMRPLNHVQDLSISK